MTSSDLDPRHVWARCKISNCIHRGKADDCTTIGHLEEKKLERHDRRRRQNLHQLVETDTVVLQAEVVECDEGTER